MTARIFFDSVMMTYVKGRSPLPEGEGARLVHVVEIDVLRRNTSSTRAVFQREGQLNRPGDAVAHRRVGRRELHELFDLLP